MASFGSRVNIVSVTSAELLRSFDLPKAVCLEFSPKNNVLATWQAYTSEYFTNCKSTGDDCVFQLRLQAFHYLLCLCSIFIG